MASQARNNENEVPNARKVAIPWNSKTGQLPLETAEPGGPYPGPVSRAFSPELKIFDLNRKLLLMNKACDLPQWSAFTDEFFEPNASLTIAICLEDGPKCYTLRRALIPRFFHTYFKYIFEPQFGLKHSREFQQSSHSVTLECHSGTLTTFKPIVSSPELRNHPGEHLNRDFAAIIRMEGRLVVDFGILSQRIKCFSFSIRTHSEHIPRHLIPRSESEVSRQSHTNLTRGGLPNAVVNFLRMCNIVNPMFDLIVRHKHAGSKPEDCLRTTISEKFQQITMQAQRLPNGGPSPPVAETKPVPDQDFPKPVVKQRRRRKQTENPPAVANKKGCRKAVVQQPPNYEAHHAGHPHQMEDQGMMTVGAPSLMGRCIRSEEERSISKLENSPTYPENSISTNYGSSPNSMRF